MKRNLQCKQIFSINCTDTTVDDRKQPKQANTSLAAIKSERGSTAGRRVS